jgi:hypothetical protein
MARANKDMGHLYSTTVNGASGVKGIVDVFTSYYIIVR